MHSEMYWFNNFQVLASCTDYVYVFALTDIGIP